MHVTLHLSIRCFYPALPSCCFSLPTSIQSAELTLSFIVFYCAVSAGLQHSQVIDAYNCILLMSIHKHIKDVQVAN